MVKKYQESAIGNIYCHWKVINEFIKIAKTKGNNIYYLQIECDCGYSKSINKDAFFRKDLLDQCYNCFKKEKQSL